MNEEKLEKKWKEIYLYMQSQDEQLQARKQNQETSGIKFERKNEKEKIFPPAMRAATDSFRQRPHSMTACISV